MKTGGTAFPVLEKDIDYEGKPFLYCDSEGMTLRDYFAGQALAGLFVRDNSYIDKDVAARLAEQSYSVANAMLAEREKENA